MPRRLPWQHRILLHRAKRDGSHARGAKRRRAFFFCRLPRVKISAQLAVWLCAVFGLVCLGAALTALSGGAALTDPAEREASFGYAAFYGFLTLIAAVFGALSWLMSRGKFGPTE